MDPGLKDGPDRPRKVSLKKSASMVNHPAEDRDPKKVVHLNRVQIGERIYVADGIKEYYAATVDGFSCAMKEIPCQSADPSSSDLQKEIIYLENLPPHPNVIKYLFHMQTTSCLRLFVQRYPQNLRQYLVERSSPPKALLPLEIMSLLLDICKGLEFLHSHKILHRNLRTDHVFLILDERRAVKSLALGELESSKLALRSSPKTVVGTPAYMSPEVLSAPTTGAYSLRADVWSLGMVLYELLTLQRPYHTVPYMLIPSHILSGRRPDLPTLSPAYEFLKEIFMQCTQLDAEARPTVERLVSSLVQAVAGDDLLRTQLPNAPSAATTTPSTARAPTLAAPPAPFVEVNGYALQQKALFDAITAAHAKMKQMEVPAIAQLLAEAAARTASVMGAVEEVCWTDKGTLTVRKLANLVMPHPLNTDAAKSRMAELQAVHATSPVLFNDPTPGAPLPSMLLVPLLTAEGRTLGTLTLANRTEGAYGSADLVSVEAIRRALVTLLADHRTSQFAQHLQKDTPLFEALFARVGSAEMVRIGNVPADVSSVVLEAELRRFVTEAKEALQLKLRFLRNLNQELRLPLNGILGVANMLSSSQRLGTEDMQYVNTIVESAELLIGLLEGLSDAAAFASSPANSTPSPAPSPAPSPSAAAAATSATTAAATTAAAAAAAAAAVPAVPVALAARLGTNFCELLEDAAGAFSYAAESKGLELLVEVDTRLPTYVVLDAPKLRQVLFYAICHVVRSLRSGLVTLSASSKSGAKKPDVMIEISVLGQSTADHKLEATEGVGMHLARSVAVALNARLEESVADASLSHVLTLPGVMDVDQSRAFALSLKELAESLSALSIVVLLPHEHVLNVVRRYTYGLALKNVVCASSVEEARASITGKVDVAIVDLDLIDEGGHAIAEMAKWAAVCKPLIMPVQPTPPFFAALNRPIRRAELFALLAAASAAIAARPKHEPTVASAPEPTPVAAPTPAPAPSPSPVSSPPAIATPVPSKPPAPFALSSSASSVSTATTTTTSSSSSSLNLPVSPATPTRLAASPRPGAMDLTQHSPRPGTPPTATSSPPLVRSPSDTRKILVVDDNPSNVKVATMMLHTLGWDTDTAENGVQGVELATRHVYAMILMDVMMPECDGLEATRRIRAMEKALNRRPVPIVAHTAAVVDNLPSEQTKLTEAGMDDVVPKPLRKERLKEAVARFCKRPEPRP